MTDDELWTIDQLPTQVAALLAENYDGQPSGRVRELPNGRAIRWYTTIGLVDRPAGNRGRAALYGTRHLLQLVAVKKLQAAGHTLAEIQAMTVGASDRTLAELAGLPHLNLTDETVPRTDAFWRLRPEVGGVLAPPTPPPDEPPAPPAPSPTTWGAVQPDSPSPASGSAAASAPPGSTPAGSAPPDPTTPPATVPPTTSRPRPVPSLTLSSTVVPSVRLGDSVTVVLTGADRVPDQAELAAITAAAAPLLDLLGRLGLAPTTGEDNG
ncbi:MerR family transcriptional regulator [Actinosynnema sp. NPDC020468]|uniref:MerR family transcriptional regulator n=1 Tax=Actinosynnema sp. NPDC020468 TaxID=3154488 RepID=UPI0033E1395F